MGKKKVAERPEYAMHLDVGHDDAEEEEEEAEVGVGGKKSNGHFAQEAEFVMGGRRKPLDLEREPRASFRLKSMRYAHKEEGHDVDDGEGADQEEEQQAIETDKAIQSRLSDADFLIPGMEDLQEPPRKAKAKAKAKPETDALFAVDSSKLENIDKDFKAATDDQKLMLLARDSPELVTLLEEYKKNMHVVKSVLAPLLSRVKKKELQTSAGMSFLHMKFHVLLLYCMHIVFYMTLKVEGKPVKDHPVIQRLVELRVYLQKLAPLEKKLRYNIERLLAASNLEPDAVGAAADGGADGDEALLRPRKENLLPLAAPAAAEAGEGDAKLYRAPRDLTSVEDQAAKRKKERRVAEKLKADIEAYEQENFATYNLTRAEKKILEAAEKREEIRMQNAIQKEEAFEGEEDADDEDLSLLQFLDKKRRAVERVKEKEAQDLATLSRKVLVNDGNARYDEDIPSDDESGGEEEGEGEDGDGAAAKPADDPDEDPFYRRERLKAEAKKQKQWEQQKRSRETVPEEVEEDDSKRKRRPAGKKIMQNRGLTPSDKKKKLNPRQNAKRRYEKQLHRHKSQAKEFTGSQYNTYSGESKISDHVVRGRKLG
eukprot:EG_transcript_5325